jgi:hypothetical protein
MVNVGNNFIGEKKNFVWSEPALKLTYRRAGESVSIENKDRPDNLITAKTFSRS